MTWPAMLTAIGSMGTVAAAVVAAAVGLRTLRQRARADERDQWWRRVEWALARILDSRNQGDVAAGLSMLEVLLSDPETDAQDARMLEAAWAPLLDTVGERGRTEHAQRFRISGGLAMAEAQGVAPEHADRVMKVSRAEVAAARLRIATDAKQGKTTPDWVRRLAKVDEQG